MRSLLPGVDVSIQTSWSPVFYEISVPSPFCRDKGRCEADAGALCLSLGGLLDPQGGQAQGPSPRLSTPCPYDPAMGSTFRRERSEAIEKRPRSEEHTAELQSRQYLVRRP